MFLEHVPLMNLIHTEKPRPGFVCNSYDCTSVIKIKIKLKIISKVSCCVFNKSCQALPYHAQFGAHEYILKYRVVNIV